jgi:hypothetical protein
MPRIPRSSRPAGPNSQTRKAPRKPTTGAGKPAHGSTHTPSTSTTRKVGPGHENPRKYRHSAAGTPSPAPPPQGS